MSAIALLCNGSTTDSGSVCLGSNPSRATKGEAFEASLFCFCKEEKELLPYFIVVRGWTWASDELAKGRRCAGDDQAMCRR